MSRVQPDDLEKSLEDFLLSMCHCLASGKLQLIDRDKNLQALADLDMFETDVPAVLKSITKEDYCAGPLLDDKGRPFQWWVFGPRYGQQTLYVKVALSQRGWLVCMSFHRNEYPLRYPFKEPAQ